MKQKTKPMQPARATPTQNTTVKKPVGDSLDKELNAVNSNLFPSNADAKVSVSSSSLATNKKSGKHTEPLPEIDDSEFYKANTAVDNTKDTLVDKHLRNVLEDHMKSYGAHKVCNLKPQLYEPLPMQKEGIYKKDFKPQDLSQSKPHYGDANNPYDCFMPEAQPANINSIYRKDFITKPRPQGEPVIRDVVSSQNDFAKHLRAPKTNDTMYKGDFPNWGVVPPPTSILPANPKTLVNGMPFFGKTTTSDYGNFMGIKDKPIKIYHNLWKSRNPLGPNLPIDGDTEYRQNMIPHDLHGKNKEPKLTQIKERVKPFEGNYSSVYQDYVAHRLHPQEKNREHCRVSQAEKEEMIVSTAKRILDEDPAMAREVFNLS